MPRPVQQRWLMIRETFLHELWKEGEREGGCEARRNYGRCINTIVEPCKSISSCPRPLSLNDSLFLSYCIHLLPYLFTLPFLLGLPRCLSGKESSCQGTRYGFGPSSGKIRWSTTWQLTPVVLPGNFHGQSSLVGYSLRGCRVGPGWAYMHFLPYP